MPVDNTIRVTISQIHLLLLLHFILIFTFSLFTFAPCVLARCWLSESMPPALATNPSALPPKSSRDLAPATDENQNMSSELALKKLQSVAEGIVEQAATQQQASCCNA